MPFGKNLVSSPLPHVIFLLLCNFFPNCTVTHALTYTNHLLKITTFHFGEVPSLFLRDILHFGSIVDNFFFFFFFLNILLFGCNGHNLSSSCGLCPPYIAIISLVRVITITVYTNPTCYRAKQKQRSVCSHATRTVKSL